MTRAIYAVDHFTLHHEEEGARLDCAGWFHSPEAVRRMAVDIPGQPSMSLPVEERGLPSQGVAAAVDPGAVSARFRLDARIPPHQDLDMAGARLNVELELGDRISIDLGRRLTTTWAKPKADRDLVMRFESLGDNCEFGLMQRHVGYERLGLLRYAGTRHADRLIEAIETGFDGFGTPEDMVMTTFGEEWIANSRRYGFTFHTRVDRATMDEDKIRAAETTKLSFMAQLMAEDFETAHKVFVRRVDENDLEAGMWPIYEALRRRGPNRLLWVTRTEPGKPHGHVERLADGLYRGFHERFAPYANAPGFDADLWISLLRSAESAMSQAMASDNATAPAEPGVTPITAPAARHRHAVDVFRVHRGDTDVHIHIAGWFHSARRVRGMALEVPGQPDLSLAIDEHGRPSPGVAAAIDPAATHARFRFDRRIASRPDLDMSGASLKVDVEGGHQVSLDLGGLLTTTWARPVQDRELVMRFESLGDNCEFGLLQREVGVERMSLLRYAGSRQIDRLVEGVDRGFEALSPADLRMDVYAEEWIAVSDRYALTIHTGYDQDRVQESEILAKESAKLAFVASLLLEDFGTAHKVFVRRAEGSDAEPGMRALHAALRRRGPNRLLWVTRTEPGKPHGHVEQMTEGLYRGFHGNLAAGYSPHAYDAELWISLLRAAEAAMAASASGRDKPARAARVAPVPTTRDGWLRRLVAAAARVREVA